MKFFLGDFLSTCFYKFMSNFKCKIFAKAGVDQAQKILDLIKLMENGGFLRDANGLNSLDSIKQLAKTLKITNFDFQIKVESIITICQKSKVTL